MTLRLRGNTKHTQKNGFEPGEITVEVTVDREEDYQTDTIRHWTAQVHAELAAACDELNAGTTSPAPKNVFSTITP